MTRRRILALAPYPPRLDGLHGGARALAELLEALGERHDIALLACRAPGEPPTDPAVASRCVRAAETPRLGQPAGAAARLVRRIRLGAALLGGTPSLTARWRLPRGPADLRELIRDWSPDVVQVHGEVIMALADAMAAGVPRILVTFEPPVRAAADARRGGGVRGVLARLELAAWRRETRRILGEFDSVVTLTDADREALAPLNGRATRDVIPLGFRAPPAAAESASSRRQPPSAPLLLFVGNFVHPPNRDAAARLVRSIVPAVRRTHPAARLRIVGDEPPAALRQAAGDGVEITGRVPDVGPHLAEATVFVAPLATGGGMRIKLLEALAAGLPVVTTPRAAEGITARDGIELLLADDDAGFVRAIASLLDDAQQRERLGAAARAWAAQSPGWSDAVAAYERLYDRLLAGAGR